VAAAGDELAASIHEISRQVQISSDIARRAVIQGDSAHETINQLTQSMSRVGQVVALIKGVADKTNLLALNATIEAARAGEAGRGFAVVAEEVKQLASQTTHATEEIATQIHHMEQDMEEAVRSVVAIGDVIRENDSIVTTVAGAVEEQGATTREISRNVDEAALGTREISRSMGTLSHTAAENGQAAGHVLLAARDLGGHAITLQREMENFLTRLRES
jgi:methyl-accepting chemotaxis protein